MVSKPSLTRAKATAASEAGGTERLEIYKMLVEMADRVSQRRQSANNFYLSVNTALVSGSAYLQTLQPHAFTVLVLSIAGIAICTLWSRNILSYKTLNEAKFAVINGIEKSLTEQPFLDEWNKLDPDGDGKRHKPFHKVEGTVPWVFAAVYLTQAAALITWSQIWDAICVQYS